MKIVDLIQDTQPWLDWRNTGIGASDVTTIIGCNPHKTKYQLWAELTGLVEREDLSNNPNIIRGKRFEDVARKIFERGVKDSFPPICITHELYDPIHASLDGYSSTTKRVLEIKCPAISSFNDVVARKRLSECYRMYYSQVQYQMLAMDNECESGILFFFCVENGESLAFNIKPDPVYQEWLMREVLWFWDSVINKIPPELDKERDILLPEFVSDIRYHVWESYTAELVKVLAKKKELEKELKELTVTQHELQDAIVVNFDGFRCGELAGVKVKVSTRKGNVNYKQLISDIESDTGVKYDLDTYRGSQSNTVLVSIDKKRGEELTTQYLNQKLDFLHKNKASIVSAITLI